MTVIQAGPCLVVQKKTADKDGYDAVQIGLVEETPAERVTSRSAGHFEKAGVPPVRTLAEFRLTTARRQRRRPGAGRRSSRPSDSSTSSAPVKGKGFQGVMKRHHFRGGRGSHGSMFHRAPGSIGASAFPSRVFKGMRMARPDGRRSGDGRRTCSVVKVDAENNLIYIRGAVPAARTATWRSAAPRTGSGD